MKQTTKVSGKSDPPYLMGLLGLIPLVGFFAGAVLLLYGVFKYRNVKLIVIGIACMLFTVFTYYSLYRFSRSEEILKVHDTFAQDGLNTLVPHIEFYKMENGVYPDSLPQVQPGMFISIYDHSQLSRHNKSVLFNYKNLGDRYLLFSSGPDGIPNTADDLLPQVNNMDGKTGWIKKE
jgi:hypothetical protein